MPTESQITHITELDFDISKIPAQFKEIEQYVAKGGANIKKSIDESMRVKPNIEYSEIEKAKAKLQAILSKTGKLGDISIKVLDDKSIEASVTYLDSFGRKLKEIYSFENDVWTKSSQTYSDNYAQREKTLDNFYKKQKSWSDIAIEMRQKESREFAAQLKEQMQNQARADKQYKSQVANIEKLIEKQKDFTKAQEVKKISNPDIVRQSRELEKQLQNTLQQLKANKALNATEKAQLDIIQQQSKELHRQAMETPDMPKEGFGSQIIDKVKWTAAFRVTQMVEQGLRETIEVMKDTEFSVMEITRVLGDSTLNVEKFTESLYNIGTEYGRQFEDVSEVTLRFAQAGYDAADALKMTETTMLALNTAELNTEEATNSLIGIMQQWNYTAEDYSLVVDKINKTADSYAITSQDLVNALLKSSSVAKNAGIEFNDLIGVLTTLKVTSGQSGDAVGNAFRSIISYIQRPSSLKGFEAMGIDVYADEAKTKLLPMMTILENMSAKWNEMSHDEQEYFMNINSGLTEALDANGEYAASVEKVNKLEAEGAEIEKINQANLAAGNLRRNYYISLMENFAQVQGVVTNLQDAEGYSLRENAKYMDTLTAKYNQFITSLKELAVQAGNSGLMDLAKGALDAATAMNKFIKGAGGVKNVLASLLGLVIVFKRQDIGKSFTNLWGSLKNSVVAAQGFFKGMQVPVERMKMLETATKGLTSINFAGWVGIGITALTTLSSILSTIEQQQKEARQRAIEAGEETQNRIDEIRDLQDRYLELASIENRTAEQNDELAQAAQNAEKALGSKAGTLQKLTAGTKAYADELERLTNEEIKYSLTVMTAAKEAAAGEVEASTKQFFGMLGSRSYILKKGDLYDLEEYEKEAYKILAAFQQIDDTTGDKFFAPDIYDVDSISEYYAALLTTIDYLNEYGATLNETERAQLVNSDIYKQTTSEINELSEAMNKYIDAQVKLAINQDVFTNGLPKTAEEFEAFRERVVASVGANEEFESIILQIVDEAFPQFSTSLDDVASGEEKVTTMQERLTTAMQESKAAIEALNSEIDSLQSAYQTLYDAQAEYNDTGSLSIDTLQELISLEPQYLQLLFDENGQVRLNEGAFRDLAIAKVEEMRVTELRKQLNAISAIKNEDEALAYLAGSYVVAATEAGALNQQLLEQIGLLTAAGTVSEQTGRKLIDNLAGINSLFDQVIAGYESGKVPAFPTGGGYSGGGGGASSANSAKQKEIRETAQAEIDALKKRQEQIKENAQAEIDALKEVQEQRDRNRERQDLIDDIESARARSGIEARKAEYEAEKELQEKEEDWDIEDRISAIEAERDAQIDALNDQIEAIEAARDAQLKAIESTAGAAYGSYVGGLIEPTANAAVDAAKQVDEFLLDLGGKNAEDLLALYEETFVIPLSKKIQEVSVLTANSMTGISQAMATNIITAANSVKQAFGVGTSIGVKAGTYGITNITNNNSYAVNNNNNIASTLDAGRLVSRTSRDLIREMNNLPY